MGSSGQAVVANVAAAIVPLFLLLPADKQPEHV